MKAKKRLDEIVKLIGLFGDRRSQFVSLLDVGTDHGLVPYMCFEKNYLNKCICSDVSKSSLKKAEILIGENKEYARKSDFRVGDGLRVLENDEKVDICVIAGMGSREIVKILGEDKDKTNNVCVYVLQSSTDYDILPEKLRSMGLEIVYDKFIVDLGHVYRTIMCVNLNNSTRQKAFQYGRINELSISNHNFNKKASCLEIDYRYFGLDNLKDSSRTHIDSLKILRFYIERLYQTLKDSISVNETARDVGVVHNAKIDIQEEKLKQINKIIDWCENLERQGD